MPCLQAPPRASLSDGDCLSFNFWWFGYVHHVPADGLAGHSMTAGLGPDVLEISEAQLASLAAGRAALSRPC